MRRRDNLYVSTFEVDHKIWIASNLKKYKKGATIIFCEEWGEKNLVGENVFSGIIIGDKRKS